MGMQRNDPAKSLSNSKTVEWSIMTCLKSRFCFAEIKKAANQGIPFENAQVRRLCQCASVKDRNAPAISFVVRP
jgi:hypothetical protein